MKKYLISICVFGVCFEANATQTFVGGVDYSGVSSFDDFNINVESGAIVSLPGDTITMTVPVNLYNSGVINGTINTGEWGLDVYNSGTINGDIDITGGGSVVQHVRFDAEMTHINVVGGGFSVQIDDYQNADFNDIKNMNADSFTITESSIVINNFADWQNWDKPVVLDGNILLIINNPESVHDGDVIKHAVNGNTVHVDIPNLDKMYKPELTMIGDQFVLHIVRNTDYSSFFDEDGNMDDSTGVVLDNLRNKNENDKLINALDLANSWAEIERIKSLSYRFNHGILLRPVKTINNFALIDALKNEIETGVGLMPYYTTSGKMDGFGGRIYFGYEYDNLYFNAGVGLHKFDYADDFNEFSGVSYTFNAESRQRFNKFFVGETIGLTLTDFKADYVSADNQIQNNPFGTSWYGDVFVGYDFDVYSNIKITPNIGFAYQRYNVADVKDDVSFVHAGAEARYDFTMDGIKYEYALSGGVDTDTNLYLNTSFGFVSITDGAGVSAEFGVLKDDYDIHYKFGLNAKLLF